MGKIGRPTKGAVKRPTRTLKSDQDIEDFLGHNAQINASEIFRTAVRALMPKDQDEIRLKEIEDNIMEAESHLSIMKLERDKIKKNLERRKRLRIDTRIESEMGAYYLRSLFLQNAFSPVKSRFTLFELIKKEINEGRWKEEDFNVLPDKIELRTNDNKVTSYLSWFFKIEGSYVYPKPSRLTMEEREYREKYYLAFKDGQFRKFADEILNGNLPTGELPIDYFMQFQPYILSDRLKNDLRKRMESEYLTVELEVS